PATSTSGFGTEAVIGRMRLPRPAASTIAVPGRKVSIVTGRLREAGAPHTRAKAGKEPGARRRGEDSRGAAECGGDTGVFRPARRAVRRCRAPWWRAAPP